jgi:dipeptidyl aminopeptidase/acylaminoacyl peptidase
VTTATDRLVELIELRRTTLLDIDDDGRMLVSNDDSGSAQLYEVSPDGQWRQLTDLGEPCSGRYLPGSRQVVVSADTGGTERAQLSLLDVASTGLSPLVHDPAYIHELLDVRADRLTYATNRRNGVDFDVIDRTVSTGAEQVLFDGGGSFSDALPSPDGRWVLLSRMTLLPASSELLLLETATGEVRSITDPGVPGAWDNPQWLPDSSALLASSDAGTDYFALCRFELAAGTWTQYLARAGENLFGWPAPTGGRLALVSTVDGADSLSIGDAAGGGAAQFRTIKLPHPGVLTFRSRILWSPDGRWLGVTFSSPIQPPEVYTLDVSVAEKGSELTRRTTTNPATATADLVEPTSHLVPTPDGEQIPTYLARPQNAGGSAVMIIHGGPEAATVRNWNPIAAALALAGHTVVLPNVRGSAGYGRRWMSMDDVGKRLDSVADLVALRDWLPEVGVDQDRIALYGGSYGGYMVLAGLAFYPGLWAAGVDIVGVSSLVTFLQNTSDYRRAYREREYGRLVEDREVLEAASPFNRIGDIRAPLFVIHGANDPRVPLSEAEQVVQAVRAAGAECPFLVYQDEGHGLAKRTNQLDAYPQAFDFLARVLAQPTGLD